MPRTLLTIALASALAAGAGMAVSDASAADGATKPKMGTFGIDQSARDTSVKPGDDFFRYVNGKWLATAKIPDDRPADGAFYMLRDKSLADVRVLVEGLAKEDAATGTPTPYLKSMMSSRFSLVPSSAPVVSSLKKVV